MASSRRLLTRRSARCGARSRLGCAVRSSACRWPRRSPALGNKRIHPFGDFMLHDVGTGDGIVQNGGPSTRNKLRTPPLWGVRTRLRLMHDGKSLTFENAILRHGIEAEPVTSGFRSLDA